MGAGPVSLFAEGLLSVGLTQSAGTPLKALRRILRKWAKSALAYFLQLGRNVTHRADLILMTWLMPSLETLGVGLCALAAFVLACFLSKLPRHWWLAAYLIPLSLMLLYSVAVIEPRVTLVPPLSWMLIGRMKIVWFMVVATMLLSAPLQRLQRKRNRIVVCLFIGVLTIFAMLPFFAPAFNRAQLAAIKTHVDGEGVCHQAYGYTCGPAAAVTALRKLGFPAEEGEIAILAHTSSFTGTDSDVLARALQKRYGTEGLKVDYRGFSSVEDLRDAGLTIAVLKFSTMIDHCVTIFGVESNLVTVADPLMGLKVVPAKEFEEDWQFVGITLKKTNGLPESFAEKKP